MMRCAWPSHHNADCNTHDTRHRQIVGGAFRGGAYHTGTLGYRRTRQQSLVIFWRRQQAIGQHPPDPAIAQIQLSAWLARDNVANHHRKLESRRRSAMDCDGRRWHRSHVSDRRAADQCASTWILQHGLSRSGRKLAPPTAPFITLPEATRTVTNAGIASIQNYHTLYISDYQGVLVATGPTKE